MAQNVTSVAANVANVRLK